MKNSKLIFEAWQWFHYRCRWTRDEEEKKTHTDQWISWELLSIFELDWTHFFSPFFFQICFIVFFLVREYRACDSISLNFVSHCLWSMGSSMETVLIETLTESKHLFHRKEKKFHFFSVYLICRPRSFNFNSLLSTFITYPCNGNWKINNVFHASENMKLEIELRKKNKFNGNLIILFGIIQFTVSGMLQFSKTVFN